MATKWADMSKLTGEIYGLAYEDFGNLLRFEESFIWPVKMTSFVLVGIYFFFFSEYLWLSKKLISYLLQEKQLRMSVGFFQQNWTVLRLESVKIGKCQNWKVSKLESPRIWKCQKLESVFILKQASSIFKNRLWRLIMSHFLFLFVHPKFADCFFLE